MLKNDIVVGTACAEILAAQYVKTSGPPFTNMV